jgi:hypothetical protein
MGLSVWMLLDYVSSGAAFACILLFLCANLSALECFQGNSIPLTDVTARLPCGPLPTVGAYFQLPFEFDTVCPRS